MPRSAAHRLVPPMPGGLGWLGPLAVAAFGGFLRFDRLDVPHAFVFDELYYAKDAYSLITYGVERQFADGAEQTILRGGRDVFRACARPEDCAAYVAHPPLGKWLIGAGEWLFGLTPFGWRFAAALAGTLSVLVLARVARRMTRSTLLGCLAGLLLALDGLHLVLSRSALLDVFLMFWVLAGFACLVADRDAARARLAEWHRTSALEEPGPRLGPRLWRLAAGLCLGAATATKWTGVLFVVAFAVMAFAWDRGARRAVGLRRPGRQAVRLDLPLVLAWLCAVPAVAYVVSFAGWLASAGGYGRNWDRASANGWAYFVVDSLRSLIDYQSQVLGFHQGLRAHHDYQSDPWGWPLLARPVLFYYRSSTGACGARSCSQAILGTGTPVVWYAGLLALLAMVVWHLTTRDWRAGAAVLGYAAGWLPWCYFALADRRTTFLFYLLPALPFLILAIVLACGLVLGPPGASAVRRSTGAALVGAFALLALADFWWLSPVLTAVPVPYDAWLSRMLLPGWV
ncbi:dolichyl-phosphate-mannose--protein mannosyltransferase [Microbispora triticiradicis]|nr:phospholipid carrier-dependent glycosyltransferase [Microbispora triticiradicis]GLW25677.1 phospholipid carrier-dependent glycosyltransferase [Microbispora amethystogenes]